MAKKNKSITKSRKSRRVGTEPSLPSNSNNHKFWTVFGYIGLVVGIATVVFQLGHFFGFRSARKQEFKSFIEYVDQIKSGIRITTLKCDTNIISPGGTCELWLSINNETQYECDLWIGASADCKSGGEIWNSPQDQVVTVSPSGITSVKRLLTFPVEIRDDTCDILVNLLFGKLSDPAQSERISSASLRNHLIIDGGAQNTGTNISE